MSSPPTFDEVKKTMPDAPFDPSYDEALSRALSMLERADDPQAADPQAADRRATDDAESRELAATLAALAELAYDAEPIAPSSSGRAALLRAANAAVLPFERRHPAEQTLERAKPEPALTAVTAPERPRRSLAGFAIAAVLLGTMLGLGYLAGTLQAARESLERQGQELARARDTVDTLQTEMASARRDLALTRSRLEMVTLTARQAYPMNGRQTADGPLEAKGIVYVCGQHQQWLLSLTGLKQPPPGEVYRLWFMTADGPVDGGVLEVDEHGDAAAEDLSMPEGTRGFSVSLEPADDPATAPHELILLGDEPVRL